MSGCVASLYCFGHAGMSGLIPLEWGVTLERPHGHSWTPAMSSGAARCLDVALRPWVGSWGKFILFRKLSCMLARMCRLGCVSPQRHLLVWCQLSGRRTNQTKRKENDACQSFHPQRNLCQIPAPLVHTPKSVNISALHMTQCFSNSYIYTKTQSVWVCVWVL